MDKGSDAYRTRAARAQDYNSASKIWLAHAVGVDCTHVGRMLRLTNLAPDMVEAIVCDDEPDNIRLEKLRRDLPLSS